MVTQLGVAVRLAIKTKLKPNNKQQTMLAKTAGTARFAYNWGLDFCKKLLEHNKQHPEEQVKFPSAIDLHKLLNACVKPDHLWFYEVSKSAPQFALIHLLDAFNRFWADPKNVGFPKFKKKGYDDGFTVDGAVAVNSNWVQIPKIGRIKVYETLAPCKLKKITVTKVAGDWYIAYTYEAEFPPTDKQFNSVGVDLGIKALATLSTGFIATGTKAYRLAARQLRRLQRSLSRKVKGSKNREKARIKVAKLHARVANIRLDTIHKLTTTICKDHEIVGIEDLNVSGMMANGKLAKALADMGFYEFRRQLEYKAKKFGNRIVVIDQWFPSSKTCSNCKTVKPELLLSERTFSCSHCGFICDRDFNASVNIEHEALRLIGLETA